MLLVFSSYQSDVFVIFTWNLPESGLTASPPVSDVSAPACTNGVWPPLRSVSVARNKPSTMSSSTVQSIDPPRTTWPDGSGRWDRQPNGCSTPALKSSAAKQWINEEVAQTKEEPIKTFYYVKVSSACIKCWNMYYYSCDLITARVNACFQGLFLPGASLTIDTEDKPVMDKC